MTFSSSIEVVNPTRRLVKVTASPEIVNQAYQTAVDAAREKAEIKGFRKGKVPESVARKFLQEDILKQAMNDVVSKGFESASKEHLTESPVVSKPDVSPVSAFKEGDQFEFNINVEVNPKIDIQNYQGIQLKLDEEWNDENCEKQVQESEKTFVDSYIKYHLNADKADEGQTTEAESAGAENTTAEQAETPTEITEDMAKALSLNSAEELKNDIRKRVTDRFNEAKIEACYEKIADHILANNNIDAPEVLVQKTAKAIANQQEEHHNHDHSHGESCDHEHLSEEQIQEQAVKQVKTIIALGHIARQEGIQVTDQELFQEIQNILKSQNLSIQDAFKNNGYEIMNEIRGQMLVDRALKRLYDLSSVSYEVTPKE